MSIPRKIINYLNTGNLVLFVIAVAIPRYVKVFGIIAKESEWLGIPIAIIIDLGQYQAMYATTKAAKENRISMVSNPMAFLYIGLLSVTGIAFFLQYEYFGIVSPDLLPMQKAIHAAILPVITVLLAYLQGRKEEAEVDAGVVDDSGGITPGGMLGFMAEPVQVDSPGEPVQPESLPLVEKEVVRKRNDISRFLVYGEKNVYQCPGCDTLVTGHNGLSGHNYLKCCEKNGVEI